MELQTAFYIVGIVFMGIMLLLTAALLIAILAIKAKVTKLHDAVQNRADQIKKITSKAGFIFRFARHFIGG